MPEPRVSFSYQHRWALAAGSKPAIIVSIINKLLTLLAEIFTSSPFDSPSLPPKLPPAKAFYEAANCPELPAELASSI